MAWQYKTLAVTSFDAEELKQLEGQGWEFVSVGIDKDLKPPLMAVQLNRWVDEKPLPTAAHCPIYMPAPNFVQACNPGPAIPSHTAVHLYGCDGKLAITKADTTPRHALFVKGFTVKDVPHSMEVVHLVQLGWFLEGFEGLTVGVTYYSDPHTPGAITDKVPEVSGAYNQSVGMAFSSTGLDIQPALMPIRRA